VFQIILTIHLGLCAFLIVVVLLQQGKGADAGAALGGGSNTLFGASGASSVLSRATTITAVAFIVTSVILVKMYPGVASGGKAGDVLENSVMSDQVHPGEDTSKEAASGAKTEAAPAAPAAK
jgi:preprotein translocase subunit SecG